MKCPILHSKCQVLTRLKCQVLHSKCQVLTILKYQVLFFSKCQVLFRKVPENVLLWARMDWTGSPEWLSLPASSASPLRSRPPVSLRPCGLVDDGIDESEACAAGARTSLDHTPAKLRSLPIPNPRRPHRGGLLEDGLLSEQPDLIQPTRSECWSTAQSKAPTSNIGPLRLLYYCAPLFKPTQK